MIKYNLNTINDWNFGDDNIIKVYKHGAVCYYKITSGDTPTPVQEPCFAVVDDITQYSDTEFEDVYDKATEKWYKLNNLNEYEEYGIYGSGRTVTTYEGKLTIDGDYEYIYSGGSWNNVGEVSGSSRVPQGYTEVEYVENTSSAYINTGVYLYDSTTNSYTIQCKHYFQPYGSDFEYLFGTEGTSSPYVGVTFRYYQRNIQYSSSPSNVTWTHINNGDGTSGITASCSPTNATNGNNPLTLFCGLWSTGPWRFSRGKIYSFTVTKNNTLVRDLVPCKRDYDSMVGMYDLVNDELYYPPNYTSYQLVAGAETGTTTYPLYYDEKSAPPDNLSFSSMAEAESYECPWVGMHATIDGDKYIFSGDSISGYEWVYNPSRLPVGYTEVEYVENKSTAFINTGFKPNQNTKILITTQCVTSTSGGRQIGAGGYDKTNAIQFDYESGAQGTLHISWGTTAGWTTYSSCVGDYDKHTYEWNGNVFYRDKGKQNQFSATTTYGTYQCTDNLGIFTRYQNGRGGGSSECFRGKLFDFKMYDNGTLIRDLVPCISPNNVVGVYDIVNDVFYGSANGNSLIAGNPI